MSKEVIQRCEIQRVSRDTCLNFKELSSREVAQILLESINNPLIQGIDFDRKCETFEMHQISLFLLASDYITCLNLSGVGIDVAKANALSTALATNRTIQSLNLSSNKMSYEEMALIFDALSKNSNRLTEELGCASQKFFAHTSVMKPKNSIPLRDLDISKNAQKSDEPWAKEHFVNKLADFLNRNWTLWSLNISGINTGDWARDDITKICSGIEGHNKDKKFQSKIENLDISCNWLSADDIELFAAVRGIKSLAVTRYIKTSENFGCLGPLLEDIEAVELGGEDAIMHDGVISTISFASV